MTLTEIYNKVVWYVFGDTASIPTSVAANLQGDEGLIAQIHRRVQVEWDYWFQQYEDTMAVTSGNNTYLMPGTFKKEIEFYFTDASTGHSREPLTRLIRHEKVATFQDPTEEAEYPTHYETVRNRLYLYPTPNQDLTLNRRYIRILPNPGWPDGEDFVTNEATMVLIYLAVIELCSVLDYDKKLNLFATKYKIELDTLRERD